jgi:hypothetical protein
MSSRSDEDESGPSLVALLEETVRNEIVQQRIILDLGLSIVDIQAMTKEVVAELLSTFTITIPTVPPRGGGS